MITSKQNQHFKLYQSLKLKKYRDHHGLFLVYGKHLVDQALLKGEVLEVITSNESIQGTLYDKKLMDDLQQAETYFDVIAVCKKKQVPMASQRVLILEDVQDPDNVGALLRSAAAFGFIHVILSLNSADLYNEKTIRASKGAIFDLYVERRKIMECLLELKDQGYHVIYADAHDQGHVDPHDKIALILGNEGHGVSPEIKALSDASVCIETKNVESLNVSVAGGILMHMWRNL